VKGETVTHLSSKGRVSLKAAFPVRSGWQTVKLTGDPVEAFALCDDYQTGWQLLDLIGPSWDTIRLLRALARLRAARVIEFIPREEGE